ncbi:MAG: fructose-1,6-bisphosphatase [Paludibacteraceae bacterium]|nr:fructose-1,6-bisphosphatase [Paludibacteraceae bacterium]
MTTEQFQQDERYLRLLSEKFPTISAAATEIINLEAILSLPKGTEHFVSDLHGADEAFLHVLKNASGVIRRKVDDIYGDTLPEEEKRALCAMIYYPEERLAYCHQQKGDISDVYKTRLLQVAAIARAVTVKYTRSKVRKLIRKDYAYIIEELLTEGNYDRDRQYYYNTIIDSIIATGKAEDILKTLCHLIHHLVIDKLHIVGDIFDRGPGAARILDHLCGYHDFDIQWGNHDIEWMGAAAGNWALIATVLRVSIRYANVETLEEDYAVNLLPLATFALQTYGNDPCKQFQTKDFESNERMKRSADLMAKMHKAISIIQFKLEGQAILRHPEYEMQDRLLLDKIDFTNGTITLPSADPSAVRTYSLLDTHFPTIDPENPYRLTEEEEQLMEGLAHSFLQSERLQRHISCLYNHGSLFLSVNNCLLYHAAIPMNADGSFTEVNVCGKTVKGRALMERIDHVIREAYYGTDSRSFASQRNAQPVVNEQLDYMWYLWCGPQSPLYNKDKMTTFERYFIGDKDLEKETKGAYYVLANQRPACEAILREFGLDPAVSKIINGHIPVHTLKGESPLRAEGMRLVIDGGFSKPYQAKTGIAGYTLIYNSHRMQLIAHSAFPGRAEAVRTGEDIQQRVLLLDFTNPDPNTAAHYPSRRLHVRDTNIGRELQAQVRDLNLLLYAYTHGLLKEK